VETSRQRFVGKKNLLLTPLLEISLISISVFLTWLVYLYVGPFRVLEFLVLAYFMLNLVTLLALKIIRTLFPFREGIFTNSKHSLDVYIWNLYGFLCITNLSLFYQNTLLPIPARKLFLQLLGSEIGKGVFAISGLVTDPHMVVIEENAILGDECYVSPHAIISLSGGDALLVKKIILKKNCIVGARALLLPGVVVGAGATVAPNVVVPMARQGSLIVTSWPSDAI
jgi:serine acetyltransferase